MQRFPGSRKEGFVSARIFVIRVFSLEGKLLSAFPFLPSAGGEKFFFFFFRNLVERLLRLAHIGEVVPYSSDSSTGRIFPLSLAALPQGYNCSPMAENYRRFRTRLDAWNLPRNPESHYSFRRLPCSRRTEGVPMGTFLGFFCAATSSFVFIQEPNRLLARFYFRAPVAAWTLRRVKVSPP